MSKIAVLLAQDFQDSELRIPVDRLRAAGHRIEIVGLRAGELLRGKLGQLELGADRGVGEVSARDYDALVIPGGGSPAHLRQDEQVLAFVRAFAASGKPIAAVCHGPLLLAAADAVRGKQLTSWPAIQGELERAGARFVDREVVVDGALITSRKPEDLEAFVRALLTRIGSASPLPKRAVT